MESIKNMIITNIDMLMMVHSEKGREVKMTDRPSFGLSLCIDGQIRYEMNGKTFISAKETAVILPKGASYTLYGEKTGLFPLINFQCVDFLCEEILVIPLQNPQSCIQCFESLKKQYSDSTNHFQTYSLLYNLLDEIFSKQTLKHPLLNQATNYIQQNLSLSSLKNVAIAKALGISEVYLRKLFTTNLNITPKQYILDLRIRKAKSLLTDTPFSITSISEECGFSSVYHFSRKFKEKIGLSPSQYVEHNKLFRY